MSGNGYYQSDSYVTQRAGAYTWLTAYSGDANNAPATTVCADPSSVVTVAKRSLNLSATAANPSGTTVTDTATVTNGAGAAGPTGTVSFSLYGPDNLVCAGAPIFTSSKPVAGNGSYVSDPFTATAAGSYRWIARYSGDADNNVAQTMCIDPGQVVTVSAPGPSQTARFLNEAYRDLLGRALTAAETAVWQPVLDLGGDRAGFALAVVQSLEFRQRYIDGDYRKYLGRAVDVPALNAFVDLLVQGWPLEIVTTLVLGSDEFYLRSGGTPAGYVDGVYRSVLGTTPDAGTRAHWVNLLNAGTHRYDVAWAVLTSHHARVKLVTTTYPGLLGRQADAFAVDYWTGHLANGLRQDHMLAFIVGSPEYLSKV